MRPFCIAQSALVVFLLAPKAFAQVRVEVITQPSNPYGPDPVNPYMPEWGVMQRSTWNSPLWVLNNMTQVWNESRAHNICVYSPPVGKHPSNCRTNVGFITHGVGLNQSQILSPEVHYMLKFRMYDICYKWTWVRATFKYQHCNFLDDTRRRPQFWGRAFREPARLYLSLIHI